MPYFGSLGSSARHLGGFLMEGASADVSSYVRAVQTRSPMDLGSEEFAPSIFSEFLRKVDSDNPMEGAGSFIRHWCIWFGSYVACLDEPPVSGCLIEALRLLTQANPKDPDGKIIEGLRYDQLALNVLLDKAIREGRDAGGERGWAICRAGTICQKVATAIGSDWQPPAIIG